MSACSSSTTAWQIWNEISVVEFKKMSNTYLRRLDVVYQRDALPGPHEEVVRIACLRSGAEPVLQCLGVHPGLLVPDDLVADPAPVYACRPAVRPPRVVERERAYRLQRVCAEEDALLYLGVRALGGEQEARAEDGPGGASGEVCGCLGAVGDSPCGEDWRGAVLGEDGEDFGQQHHRAWRGGAPMTAGLVACRGGVIEY